ncbi:nascent polypeptide-associated complex subunit alpha, muscle-specific form-like [Equus asinus]|uniref:nascent polypeptide-associated complex subunit alpha, muscle-specific form-like n=1 Tax=Equus asinus TaxID=9793 RepID=UPI0038F7E23D
MLTTIPPTPHSPACPETPARGFRATAVRPPPPPPPPAPGAALLRRPARRSGAATRRDAVRPSRQRQRGRARRGSLVPRDRPPLGAPPLPRHQATAIPTPTAPASPGRAPAPPSGSPQPSPQGCSARAAARTERGPTCRPSRQLCSCAARVARRVGAAGEPPPLLERHACGIRAAHRSEHAVLFPQPSPAARPALSLSTHPAQVARPHLGPCAHDDHLGPRPRATHACLPGPTQPGLLLGQPTTAPSCTARPGTRAQPGKLAPGSSEPALDPRRPHAYVGAHGRGQAPSARAKAPGGPNPTTIATARLLRWRPAGRQPPAKARPPSKTALLLLATNAPRSRTLRASRRQSAAPRPRPLGSWPERHPTAGGRGGAPQPAAPTAAPTPRPSRPAQPCPALPSPQPHPALPSPCPASSGQAAPRPRTATRPAHPRGSPPPRGLGHVRGRKGTSPPQIAALRRCHRRHQPPPRASASAAPDAAAPVRRDGTAWGGPRQAAATGDRRHPRADRPRQSPGRRPPSTRPALAPSPSPQAARRGSCAHRERGPTRRPSRQLCSCAARGRASAASQGAPCASRWGGRSSGAAGVRSLALGRAERPPPDGEGASGEGSPVGRPGTGRWPCSLRGGGGAAASAPRGPEGGARRAKKGPRGKRPDESGASHQKGRLASPSGNRTPVSRVTGGDTHRRRPRGRRRRPGARPALRLPADADPSRPRGPARHRCPARVPHPTRQPNDRGHPAKRPAARHIDPRLPRCRPALAAARRREHICAASASRAETAPRGRGPSRGPARRRREGGARRAAALSRPAPGVGDGRRRRELASPLALLPARPGARVPSVARPQRRPPSRQAPRAAKGPAGPACSQPGERPRRPVRRQDGRAV